MTAYQEAAFLADLLMGCDIGSIADEGPDTAYYEVLYAHAGHLNAVVDRLRHQTRMQVHIFRAWHRQHQHLRLSISRKYSTLEGLLRRQDLRQHWILYRCAMREMHQTRRQCNVVIDRHLRRNVQGRRAVTKSD